MKLRPRALFVPLLAVVGPVLGGAVARAQPPAPAAAPVMAAAKPAPELEQIKYFIGTWKCAGKQLPTPIFGPAHEIIGSAQGKLDLDGFWEVFSYEEKKTKEHPGLRVMGLWGYDAAGRRFVRSVGSNNGIWDAATSTGWDKDKMVWTGELAGAQGRMPFRQTFTRKTDKSWTHRMELNARGVWMAISEVTCTKK